MKILFASAEVAPFSKVGGLADVVGSLPKALEKDAEICIFTPLYGSINQEKYGIKELENSSLKISMGNTEHIFKLKMCKLPGTKINVFFVDNPKYYSCFNCVYPQWVDTMYEQQRYVAFSLAVLEYAKLLNFRADVIHANDWHTAMIPVYIKNNYKYDDFYKDTKTVFSIHNLAYQGACDPKIIDFANMRWDNVYNDHCVEHYGKVNWVKGAIYCSDKIIAVSEKYAQEIMGEEFGEGMDYTLRDNAWKVMGITNGIDYTEFNPKTDKNLVKNYDLSDMTGKEACKKEIVEKFGMPYCPNTPSAYNFICGLSSASTFTPFPYLKSITCKVSPLIRTQSAVPNPSGTYLLKSTFCSTTIKGLVLVFIASDFIYSKYVSVWANISLSKCSAFFNLFSLLV